LKMEMEKMNSSMQKLSEQIINEREYTKSWE
jgi:hypothetical protein